MQCRRRVIRVSYRCLIIAASVGFCVAACAAPLSRSGGARWHGATRPLASRGLIWRRPAVVETQAADLPSATPSREVRGLWVVRNSIETPAAIANVVASAKASGFNALFVQVRGRGDAYYDSTLEPRAEELAGQPTSFDPLQTVITDAHAAGLQVHAWVNMCYVWSAGRLPKDPTHIVNAHPDWLAQNRHGDYHLYGDATCEGAFLSPSNPQVRRHLHDVVMQIVDNYDIDGIHFDYIRYPNANYDYSRATEQRFADFMRPQLAPSRVLALDKRGPTAYVAAFPNDWASWRRDRITSLVEWISRDVKLAKPRVCISAAVFANYDDAYNVRGQDWKRWLKDGALDAIIPEAYSRSTAVVSKQIAAAEATAKRYGRACYAGIGSWRISAASTLQKIAAARADGAQGIVLFSYSGVTQDGATDKYLAEVGRAAFESPASAPRGASVGVRTAKAVPLNAKSTGRRTE